jgi:hypothetical protein
MYIALQTYIYATYGYISIFSEHFNNRILIFNCLTTPTTENTETIVIR